MIGRLADLFRLFWGLIYWNTRKTLFRLRGGRGRCPCQSPSDSGRAFETSCEASLTWQRQERFSRVCPLLRRDKNGQLRCSVDTAAVRPFWGRAFLIFGGTGLALYLALTLAAFVFLRGVGYPVSYGLVVWPGRWSERHQVRGEFFAAKAKSALARRDANEALIAYSLAYQYDPKNFSAGLSLAQLAQTMQPALADQVYGQMLQTHPPRAAVVLTAWYQSLLLRGDFRAIVPMAAQALKQDREHLGAWLHALLFALEREPSDQALRTLVDDAALPAEARAVLALEARARTASPEEMKAVLTKTPAQPFAYLDYYRPKKLIDLGFAAQALALLNRLSEISPRDGVALVLRADAVRGGPAAVRIHFDRLLAGNPAPSTLELLAIHLVAHPDPALIALLLSAQEKPSTVPAPQRTSAAVALVCAAGAGGDAAQFRGAVAQLRAIDPGALPAIAMIEAFFANPKSGARIETILPFLQPQSMEMNYALLARYHRPRSVGAVPGKPSR